jgi:hypothetical protein
MKKTLKDIQVEYNQLIAIFCDNNSAINISKNLVMHSKTNHIPIMYHFLREKVTKKNVKLEYIGRKEQVVDIFTNPLYREAFEYLRQNWGWYLFHPITKVLQETHKLRGRCRKTRRSLVAEKKMKSNVRSQISLFH